MAIMDPSVMSMNHTDDKSSISPMGVIMKPLEVSSIVEDSSTPLNSRTPAESTGEGPLE